MRSKFIPLSILFLLSINLSFLYADLVSSTNEKINRDFPRGMEERISLDLRNIDIVDALKFLAEKAGINIVTTKKVSGRVTLKVDNVPIKDIFDVMLRSNSLAYDKRGNIYNVMTEEEYKALYGKNFSDPRQVKIIDLKYALPEQIFSLCDVLKSDIGRVLVNPESGKVVIMDSPEKIKEIEEAIKGFEKKNIVKVFDINYGDAKEIAERVKSQLEAKKVGTVQADEATNQIIIQTLPERMKEIERIIKKLDRKTREVLIEGKIIKVKFSKNLTESVEWEGLFDIARKHGLTYLGTYPFSAVQATTDAWRSRKQVWQDTGYVGSYPFSGTTSNYSGGKSKMGLEEMHIGIIGKHDFDALIKSFREIGKTQIISTPKIIITDNQEANLHVGERQAYVTTTTTTGQTTSTVSEEVNFVDVGTILSLTPRINEEGYITLKIKAEVSTVISELITPTENKIPIIDTSTAETTVMVKDGTPILIGGLRKEEKGLTSKKVPLLGDIPLLGKLFTSYEPTQERTELLIVLTPRIISGDMFVGYTKKDVGEKPIKGEKVYWEVKLKEKKELEKELPLTKESKFKGFKF